ncbi:hypothetical protein HJC23_001923 [Cyclotella cryptica]|uniref:Chitin-binding type-1 domain-containing protein n=1 Tax=Cyclotella cryptica TaxID=29204 RepID=A0ABD3P1Z5_9STRA
MVILTSTVFPMAVLSSSSPNCGWQTIDLDLNSPTYNPNGLSCDSGKCCSKDGFCSSGTNDCQAGCQSAFGSCDAPVCGFGVEDDIGSIVCSMTSQCCSKEGFCGTEDDACGIGCQYGNCKHTVPWIDGNPPPDGSDSDSIPEYSTSSCMRDVYDHFVNKDGDHPVCRAKDVHSFTATLVGDHNPSSCKRASTIIVTFAAGFTVNSAVGRHDIAMYTARDALCHGDTPSINDGNCARDGSSCSVTVMGDSDIALDPRIKYDDKIGGNDSCADISDKGMFEFAPRTLEIPCEGRYKDGEWTHKVVLQTCISWRQPGGDINCDEYGAFPGATSNACEYIELEIPIISPTSSPTVKPTSFPTTKPTKIPTRPPTYAPTIKPSKNPTAPPTFIPTSKPTKIPTAPPTSTPTSKPTKNPTAPPTSAPTNKPTKNPTAPPTLAPSQSPSSSPSLSPSHLPSMSPTSSPSQQPSKSPSTSPSSPPSQGPSASPSNSPSLSPSASPSQSPSMSPSMSPTSSPTEKPTISPSRPPSASPTSSPSQSPSVSPSTSPSRTPTAPPSNKPTLSSGVGNKVWDDLNANGIQDPGEPGIENVEVRLRSQDGAVVSTTHTGPKGYYKFDNIVPGTYSVEFSLPSGYKFTKSADLFGDLHFDSSSYPADGSYLFEDVTSDAHVDSGITDTFDLEPGEINLSLDAGVYRPSKIIGVVWHDLNANGVRDPQEPGIPDASITLYNDDDENIATTKTDSLGNYLFDELIPKTYYGKIQPPNSDYFLSPMGRGTPLTYSDFDPNSRINSPVTLQSGDINQGYFDAGLYLLASVGDLVWLDLNYDGIQDTDEPGFPFPVTINLYDYLNKELLSTFTTGTTGAYAFKHLTPGNYELEFLLEEGDTLSPPFKGSDKALDSNVDPKTNKALVTLISGEVNDSVDAGIISEAPYYPDWTFETQVCTNDGFDPDWMSQNEGRIYLYRNKEECCQNHFWWRMTQCMANEQYKFYRNGEICDVKIDFDFWQGEATWSESTLFDTKDECCANLFYYDFTGCMERSPVDFKFDFCLDLASLVPPVDCQTADIYANVIEDAMNLQLGDDSDTNVTLIGDVALTKIDGGAGSTVCGGRLGDQGFINNQTGSVPDLSNPPSSTTVCGVISTRSYNCTQDVCLVAKYDKIVNDLTASINDGSMTNVLQARATGRLPPVPELKQAAAIPGTFSTSNLLLPATISSQLGETKFFKDGQKCGTKTAFASWEIPYDSLIDCCTANFNWQFDTCCAQGGGCNDNASISNPMVTPTMTLLYYPTWTSGSLCDRKPQDSFEVWDLTYTSLKECCKDKFAWDYDNCCQSSGMGGCV